VNTYLSDALGSVRQLTNGSGAVTYARAYDPGVYPERSRRGVVTATSGASTTPYGYTGEYTTNDLVYLRARHYDPAMGRFLTRDAWDGDANSPLSFNGWNYTDGNPINYLDPSGHITEGMQAKRADLIVEKLKEYNVYIKKDWGYLNASIYVYTSDIASSIPTLYFTNCEWQEGNWRNVKELQFIFDSVRTTAKVMGGSTKFKTAMGNRPILVTRFDITSDDLTYYSLPFVDILLTNSGFSNANYVTYTVTHELGHIWDIRSVFQLSSGMSRIVGTHYCDPTGWPCFYDVHKGKEFPPGDPDLTKNYAATNAREDWAEAFATYIDPTYYGKNGNNYPLGPMRKRYVQNQIKSIP